LKKRCWCSGIFDPLESGGFKAELAVDGDPNTRWAGHPPERAWIALDLGSTLHIEKVKVRFERAFAKEYDIFIAADNQIAEPQDSEIEWKHLLSQ